MGPDKLKVIQATLPVVKEHGEAITRRFYQGLFEKHPELKNIFNMSHQRSGHQPKALADAVYGAAANIEDMSKIMPVLERIGEKHRSLQVKPEHYPIVGEHLLGAIKDVLGDAATDEILDAWADAYDVISDVFIRMEDAMYRTTENLPGGWAGFKDFVVDKKVAESDVITSFYLKPADGKPLVEFLPGQYITLKADIPGEEHTHLRQYSLSDRPGESYYRISVKREDAHDGDPAGVVSTYLHSKLQEGDTIAITAPAGDFYLDVAANTPVVLISGGVGITPLLSMLNTIAAVNPTREVTMIQAARHGKVHAFGKHVKQLADTHPSVKSFVIYQEPTQEDQAAKSYDQEGHITSEWLKSALTLQADTDYYFCGPRSFMHAVHKQLKELGVPANRVHYEFFGSFGNIE
nr:NO-inducible flavohemoprotein [Paenibacillus phyllosphaerae]